MVSVQQIRMSLKKYNVLTAVRENKFVILILLLVGNIIGAYTPNKDLVLIYGVGVILILVMYFTKTNYQSFRNVRNYIALNEQEINNKYGIKKGIGYVNYYRNFSDSDIDKMLNTPVKEDFIKCYKYPIKLALSFLILILIFIIASI